MEFIDIIKNIDTRPSWNDYFMILCYLISKRSSCERLHVGCVLVKDRRIIATGYNGHLPGTVHDSVIINGHEQMTIHAETNAIADAAKRGISVADSTAYVTHIPCINCVKILLASGIIHIIYGEDYKNDPLVINLCERSDVTISKYYDI